MHPRRPGQAWAGGRWVVRTEAGQRLPLTLSMVFFDSSGTNKEGARKEHRDVLKSVVAAADAPDADPFAVTCAIDWLLYDWLMAHRDGPDSAEIVFQGLRRRRRIGGVRGSRPVAARATFDPGLVLTPR